jgi:hypothetical protein
VFAPKDKIGDWLEMYTKVMELNYWGSTTAKKATYDEAAQRWDVVVERGGQEITLRPKELVFALGVSGYPNVPQIAGADSFLFRKPAGTWGNDTVTDFNHAAGDRLIAFNWDKTAVTMADTADGLQIKHLLLGSDGSSTLGGSITLTGLTVASVAGLDLFAA